MAGVFDGWALSNSRSVPQYQGSAVPELQKVADVMENRYDTGQQQADLIDQMVKTSTAAPVDQPLLDQIKQTYRDKLADYKEKGNYEDMWRNVAMDARDFAGSVRQLQGNQKAIADWTSDLNKRVGEGKLDPEVAHARQLQMMDTYSGMKMDPDTGELTNSFQGASTVPSIDIPEKINKIIQDAKPMVRGWKTEKDINGWYVTNGSERHQLTWDPVTDSKGNVIHQGLKNIVDSGIALDPEIRGWMSQERELAPYYAGVSSKLSPSQVQNIIGQTPALKGDTQALIDRGMDPATALHQVLGQHHVDDLVGAMHQYAMKGVIDESKSEYAEHMDPLTEDRLKKQNEKMLFSVPFSDVSPGTKISSVGDFDDERRKAASNLTDLTNQLQALRHAPNVTNDANGRTWRTEPDGTKTDITEDANRIRGQMIQANTQLAQYDAIRKAAADATGYDPSKVSAAVSKAADQAAADYVRNATTGSLGVGSGYAPTQDELDSIHQTASKVRDDYIKQHVPGYEQFQKELISRMQPQGEGNKLWVFQDDQMKKTLGDFSDAAISNLGLDKGLVSLKIGSGQDAGKDLTASDYNDIKGKIVPVGIENDARTGDTRVVMRSLEDTKGKKTKGENLLMTIGDVGQLDDYMRTHTSPQEYNNFVMDRTLKSGLNNVAGMMNFPITDEGGVQHGSVQITRKRGYNQGPGAFSLRIPTTSGWKQVSVDSYEGVIDKLQQIQQLYHGRNNTAPH